MRLDLTGYSELTFFAATYGICSTLFDMFITKDALRCGDSIAHTRTSLRCVVQASHLEVVRWPGLCIDVILAGRVSR